MKFLKLFEEWNSDKSSVNESLSTARERFLNTGKVSQEEFEEALSYDSSKTKKYLEKILDLYVKEREVNGKPMKEIGNTIEKFNELVQRNKISNSAPPPRLRNSGEVIISSLIFFCLIKFSSSI